MPTEDEQREIVALLRIAHEAPHLTFHQLCQLLRSTVGMTAHKFTHMLPSEQLIIGIAGLTQTVSIKKQRVAALQRRLLTLIMPVIQ